MDRRSFLNTATLFGTAAASGAVTSPALAQGTRTLTMLTAWERGQTGLFGVAQRIAQNVAAMSDGGLTIDVIGAGERVGPFEVFDPVVAGQADMYHAADHYFTDQQAAYAFFGSVPFGMTAQELASWYYHGSGQAMHDELGKIFGLKSFLAGNTGPQPGGWFRSRLDSPEDLDGMTIRMAGLGGAVLSRLGVTVKTLTASETRTALASGNLDAAEWIGPWGDEALGLQDAAGVYYTAGFHEPGAALSLGVNRDTFQSLTPSQQKTIEIASAEAYQWSLAQFERENAAAISRLESSGVQLLDFPDSVWNAFAQTTKDVHRTNSDDTIYDWVHEDYFASLREAASYSRKSRGAYTHQRRRLME